MGFTPVFSPRLLLQDLHLALPKIVLRLRAPSSCSDPFAKSRDEDGARRRETNARRSSFNLSQENKTMNKIPSWVGNR